MVRNGPKPFHPFHRREEDYFAYRPDLKGLVADALSLQFLES